MWYPVPNPSWWLCLFTLGRLWHRARQNSSLPSSKSAHRQCRCHLSFCHPWCLFWGVFGLFIFPFEVQLQNSLSLYLLLRRLCSLCFDDLSGITWQSFLNVVLPCRFSARFQVISASKELNMSGLKVGLASGSDKQHERPPELRVKDGGKPNFANRVTTRLDHALLALVVACHRAMPPNCPGMSRPPPNLTYTPYTHAKLLAVPSSGLPGLPPSVFANLSSRWRPPTPSWQLARTFQRNEDPTRPDAWGERTTASFLFCVNGDSAERFGCFPNTTVMCNAFCCRLAGWLWDWHFPTAASTRTANHCWDGSPKLALLLNAFLPSPWRHMVLICAQHSDALCLPNLWAQIFQQVRVIA